MGRRGYTKSFIIDIVTVPKIHSDEPKVTELRDVDASDSHKASEK